MREDAMRSVREALVVAALAAVFVLAWHTTTDQDIAVAQERTPVRITRIFTGPDGLSHSQEIDAPSGTIQATGVQFSSRPPSDDGNWHTGPRRQYVITLSGSGELELANGEKVRVGPGHINLIEDTTGKGHITRNFGPENRVTVTIVLADQPVVPAR
jgi:hypothetical protein